MYNPFSLSGKTILVTGASSGIGRATAIECAKMGANVIITGRSAERLNETFEQCKNVACHVSTNQIVADLSIEEEINMLVENASKLDGVVNNAGIARPLLVHQLESSDISEVFGVNVFASILLINKLLQNKKINKKASMVFTSSISGVYCSSLGGSLYSASKGAINGFLKGAALDLAARGIRVNSVNPGLIATQIFSEGTLTEEQLQEEISHYPLKRFGKPEDVAMAIVYLLSDASEWVTGTNLKIDGGFTLR